jgi:hypothetical protein
MLTSLEIVMLVGAFVGHASELDKQPTLARVGLVDHRGKVTDRGVAMIAKIKEVTNG